MAADTGYTVVFNMRTGDEMILVDDILFTHLIRLGMAGKALIVGYFVRNSDCGVG